MRGELLRWVWIGNRGRDLQYVIHVSRIHLEHDEPAILHLSCGTRVELDGGDRTTGGLLPREHRLHVEPRLITGKRSSRRSEKFHESHRRCLLYTSDAADEEDS